MGILLHPNEGASLMLLHLAPMFALRVPELLHWVWELVLLLLPLQFRLPVNCMRLLQLTAANMRQLTLIRADLNGVGGQTTAHGAHSTHRSLNALKTTHNESDRRFELGQWGIPSSLCRWIHGMFPRGMQMECEKCAYDKSLVGGRVAW